jgi:hypothetical protein
MSIDKIINGKYESFSSVEAYIRLKDEYEDVSTPK